MLGLDNQRIILEEKLSGRKPILSVELTEAYARNAGLILSSEHHELLMRLGVLSRLLDNLIDDEGVNPRDIIREIRNPDEIFELAEFRSRVSSKLEQEFVRNGSLIIRIAAMYNKNPTHTLRFMEARVLSRLYGILLCEGNQARKGEIEEGLYHLMVAGYMFCDLKHLYKDKKSPNPALSFGYLAHSLVEFFSGLKHPFSMMKDIASLMKKSIASEFESK